MAEEQSYPRKVSSKTVTTVVTTTKYMLSPVIGFEEKVTNGKKGVGTFVYKGTTLKDVTPRYMKPEFLEVLKDGIQPFSDWNNNYALYEFAQPLPEDIADVDVSLVFFAYGSGHILFGPDERIVPTLYQFNYIEGAFDNRKYRLKDLIQHLKQHPWVVKKVRKEVLGYRTDEEDLLSIQNIPSYNRDDDRDRYIQFYVLPPQEELQKLYLIANQYGKSYFSVRLKEYIEHPDWFAEDTPLGQALREAGVYDPLGLIPFQKKKKKDDY